MQPTLGQVQDRTLVQRGSETRMSAAASVKEIPYDYVATFILEGRRGNRVQQVINISTEGAFVAVAVGYSFVPTLEVKTPFSFDSAEPLNDTSLVRLLSAFIEFPRTSDSSEEVNRKERDAGALIAATLRGSLAKLSGIDFKYSVVDSGSGRELQNLAIHNIAGLGEPSGGRPFRPMAKPMLFMPRSTIRIEVQEISEGPLYAKAELFIVLHGYKMIGYGIG